MGGKDVFGTDEFKKLATSKWTFTADKITTSSDGPLDKPSPYKIDPSKNPKTIDFTIKAGDTEGVSRGIYKLEGDTLTLCRTVGDIERPKEFKTTAEAGFLVVWKRAKK